ncbi:MAG: hypothetical protein A2048_03945 [Deltaproteobacteria bacterium GWA2_45_12]|nr:MAG: hypothetical protein A2048_03945 [Deltaproteobacteria bacterium GWA2_45_12]
MKKGLFVLMMLLSFSARAAGPEGRAEVVFSKGLLEYNDWQYARAAVLFSEAASLNPRHHGAAYFAGLSHYNLKNSSQAIGFFKKAADLVPQDPSSHLFLGLSLWKEGKKEEARFQFETVLKLKASSSEKEIARGYLETNKSSLKKESAQPETTRPFFAYASLTTLFDSNVTLEPNDLSLSSLPSDKDDWVWGVGVGTGYHFVNREKYGLMVDVSHNHSIHAELEDFNYGVTHVGLTERFTHGSFWATLPLVYEASMLGSEGYLQSFQWNPNLGLKHGTHFISLFRPRARRDVFLQDTSTQDQDRDAWAVEGSFSEYFILNKKQSAYIMTGYTFGANLADGDDWDYLSHTLQAVAAFPLFWDLGIQGAASYLLDKNFFNTDSILGEERSDDAFTLTGSLYRRVGAWLTVTGFYSYTSNSSNIDYFEYKKHVGGLSLGFRY